MDAQGPPGPAGLAQNRKSVYLESCRRLRIGQNQGRNKDHTGEVAWPLCSRENDDGTSLQSKTGQDGHMPAWASAHISNKPPSTHSPEAAGLARSPRWGGGGGLTLE